MIDEYSSKTRVLVAVKENGLVLKCTSYKLKDDKEVVLAAVMRDVYGRACIVLRLFRVERR